MTAWKLNGRKDMAAYKELAKQPMLKKTWPLMQSGSSGRAEGA